MSFPNPDNYARDCDCGTAGANTTPPPAAIQSQLTAIQSEIDDLYGNIPAPIVHIDTSSDPSGLKVSYIPADTRSQWLTTNTEVWLFAYKKAKYNGLTAPGHRFGRFAHPVDTSRAPTNSAFYGGNGGAEDNFTYHTEFPFLNGTAIPEPYVHVPLTNFNSFEFFRTRTDLGDPTTRRQLLSADFPIIGSSTSTQAAFSFNKKRFNCYAYGSTFNNLAGGRTVKFQLRFVIPNPNAASTGFPKIMGPPSTIIYCLPKYNLTGQAIGLDGRIDGIRLKL